MAILTAAATLAPTLAVASAAAAAAATYVKVALKLAYYGVEFHTAAAAKRGPYLCPLSCERGAPNTRF